MVFDSRRFFFSITAVPLSWGSCGSSTLGVFPRPRRKTSPCHLGRLRASLRISSFSAITNPPRVAASLYGLESRSALPVSRSTGTETCSCTMSHLRWIFRYTSVTLTTKSAGEPFA